MTSTEIEAQLRGFLLNAAARQWAVSQVDPEQPSADYLTGFGAGWEAGQVAALAFALSMLTGGSVTEIIEDARAQAAVDAAFPFELHVLSGDEEGEEAA
jgi:hypothetical protein